MNMMQTEHEIPKKSLFKVAEVCELTGVRPYVLRFWESEFDIIAPIVGDNGQKLYEHKDIEAIGLIKKLLFEDKLTIEKAKFHISEGQKNEGDEVCLPVISTANLYLKRSFTDSEWQKIILAKAKLSSLISLCGQIQESHRWS